MAVCPTRRTLGSRLVPLRLIPLVTAALGLLTAALPADPPVNPQRGRVAILCTPYRSYQEAAESLRSSLEAAGRECILIALPKGKDEKAQQEALRQLRQAQPTVVAASGAGVTTLALEALPEVPVVFFMVPNALDAEFMQNRARARVTGVAADVEPRAQIERILRLHPKTQALAVPCGDRTRRTVAALKQAARRRNIRVNVVEVTPGGFVEALRALDVQRTDGVVMVLDPEVYNSASVEHLLLWGLRQQKPIWAFSASIVKAGALAGSYPDSEAVGRQTAELVLSVLKGTPPADLDIQYPRAITHAVNLRTAEMLHLHLTEAALGEGTLRFGAQP